MSREENLKDVLRKYRKKYFLRIPEYVPASCSVPRRSLDVISAWKGNELVIEDIIRRFDIPTETCLEFGVEFG